MKLRASRALGNWTLNGSRGSAAGDHVVFDHWSLVYFLFYLGNFDLRLELEI